MGNRQHVYVNLKSYSKSFSDESPVDSTITDLFDCVFLQNFKKFLENHPIIFEMLNLEFYDASKFEISTKQEMPLIT